MSKRKNHHLPNDKKNTPVVPAWVSTNTTMIPPPVKKSFWVSFKKFIKKGYTIAGILMAIIGWYFLKDSFHNEFSSKHTKWKEEAFINGILIPDNIKDYGNDIVLVVGAVAMSVNIDTLKSLPDRAIKIPTYFKCKETTNPPIIFGLSIINNRLRISTTFRDFQKSELVGRIKENKWELFKNNLLDYYDDDSTFEVYDRGGYTIFSMRFTKPNYIELRGYFVSNDNVCIIDENMLSPCNPLEDKKKLIDLIQTIKPFSETNRLKY